MSVIAEPLTDDDGRIAGALVLAGLSPPDGMPDALRQTVGRLFAMALRRDRRDREVQDLIYRDPLTGLPNRRCFDERLAETFARGVDAASPVSVLFMDLDEFKKVNDTLGHEFGDLLLAIVGSRLRRALSTDAFVARLGGDEFGAIVTADAGAATAAAGRITKALKEPAMLRGYRLPIYCSIGIATCPDHESDPALLKRLADMAMYYAKQSATGIASAANTSGTSNTAGSSYTSSIGARRISAVRSSAAMTWGLLCNCSTSTLIGSRADRPTFYTSVIDE